MGMNKPETTQPELGFTKSSKKFFIFNFMSIAEKYNMYFAPSVDEQGYISVYFTGKLCEGTDELAAY